MFPLKVLGAVFVSLILFMPMYQPVDVFARCCLCNQCKAGCTCGCGCGDENGKMACITKIDKDKKQVIFKDKSTDEEFGLPYVDEQLDKKKVGDCGMVKTKTEEVQVCIGFAMEPGSPRQQGEPKK